MQKDPLRVKLKPKERGYYANMYRVAAKSDEGTVGGQDAVTFFKRSGLSVDKLKHIWTIAAQTSKQYLTKDEFYVALRLIAYE